MKRQEYVKLAEEFAEKAAKLGYREHGPGVMNGVDVMSREEDRTAAIVAQTYAILALMATE